MQNLQQQNGGANIDLQSLMNIIMNNAALQQQILAAVGAGAVNTAQSNTSPANKYDLLLHGDASFLKSTNDFNDEGLHKFLYNINDDFKKLQAYNTACDAAKRCGCLTNFKELYKTYEKQQKEKKKQELETQRLAELANQSIVGMTNYKNLPADLQNMYVPAMWDCTDSGIIASTPDGRSVDVCTHPVMVTRLRRSITTGEEQVEIAYKKGEKWKTRVFEKSILASASNISALYNYGISVTSDNAKPMVKFFQNQIDENERRGVLPVTDTVSKMGWLGKDSFFPYVGCDGIEFEYEDKYPGMIKNMAPTGNLEKWLVAYSKQRKHKSVLFIESISLAAPIIGMLGGNDGIVGNLYGFSGSGKSVASTFVRSIWSNPIDGMVDDKTKRNEKSAMLCGADTTLPGVEARLDLINNLCLFIEDAENMKINQKKDLPALIYRICNGESRNRADRTTMARQSKTWRTTGVITSENDITSYCTTVGGINRCLTYHAPDKCPYEDISGTMETIRENYAVAGVEYIKALIEERDNIKNIIDENERELARIASDKNERQIHAVAIILTASQIAERHVFKDGIVLTKEEALEFMADKDESSQYKRFYDKIISECTVHKNNFEGGMDEDRESAIFWGVMQYNRKEECDIVSILPTVLHSLAKEENVDVKMFVSYLKSKNLIITNKNENLKTVRYTCHGGGVSKMYSIKIPLVEPPEEERRTDDGSTSGNNEEKPKQYYEIQEYKEEPVEFYDGIPFKC